MRIMQFLTRESGATAIEYAMIAGGVSIVILAAVQVIGGDIFAIMQGVAAGL